MANRKDLIRLQAGDLYVFQSKSVKAISRVLGVHVNTVFRWKKMDKWDLRKQTYAYDPGQYYAVLLTFMQRQQEAISSRPDRPFPTSTEADQIVKSVHTLTNLKPHNRVNLTGYVMIFREFVSFLRFQDFTEIEQLDTYIADFLRQISKKSGLE
jgi:Uncharacterized conserved protein